MVTRVPIESRVIAWARKVSGLTVEEAATLFGCNPDLIRKIEAGKQFPSVSMFRDMADKYGFPEATLMAADPPELPAIPTDHRTFDGAMPKLTYKTLLAIRSVQFRQESIQELSEIDGDISAPQLRRYVRSDKPEIVASAERKRFAMPVRDQLQSSADKLWMTYRMRIEALGVAVYVEDYPIEDCRGVSLFVGNFPAIILSSNEKRAEWKLFSLLHEYAHLLIREPGISDQKHSTRDSVERFCNQFAAAFLMPEPAISAVLAVSRSLPQEFPIATLEEAARAIGVSISALALRLEDLGFAPVGYFNRVRSLIRPPTARPPKDGQPPRKYMVLNQYGHRYSGDVLRSLDNGVITPLEASRMLQANPNLLPSISSTIESRRRDYLYAGAEG